MKKRKKMEKAVVAEARLIAKAARMEAVSEKISKILADSDLDLDEGLSVITEQVLCCIRYATKTSGRCSRCLLTRMVQILEEAPDLAKHVSELIEGGSSGPTVH